MADHTAAAEDLWATIDDLHTWLDDHRTHDGREELLLRMLKLTEEVGEVAQAVIGAAGHNPRKGTRLMAAPPDRKRYRVDSCEAR